LNLAEMSVVKSRPSVPHQANLFSFQICSLTFCTAQSICFMYDCALDLFIVLHLSYDVRENIK